MRARAAAWLAWSLCTLSVAAAAIGNALFLQSGHIPPGAPVDVGGPGFQSVDMVVFAAVGPLIASRQPSNPVGWLLCFVGFTATIGLNGLGYGYAYDSLEGPTGVLPAANWLAWLTAWVNTAGIWAGALALQLFPNGRPVSRRWWPVVCFTFGLATLATLVQALRPGLIENFPAVTNPLDLPGAAGAVATGLFEAGGGILHYLSGPAALLLGPPAILVRLWRARGAERQQLKWVVYAWTIVPLYFVLLVLAALPWPEIQGQTPVAFIFWSVGWTVAVATLPGSIGIAILRYRLYDIDLIIRRTLIYGGLTSMLAVIYWLSVVLLQGVLRPLTQSSELAIVASTLGVAALSQPARQHIQALVDRHFYRQRYDATRTLEAFSSRLRHEVGLDSLGAELRAVVGQTMQPQRVSLWLRPPTGRTRS